MWLEYLSQGPTFSMSRATSILMLFIFLVAACERNSSFNNYGECVTKKTAEYIDVGANVPEGESRAGAFCEIRYPLLQPSFQPVQGVTVRVEYGSTCLDFDPLCDRYIFHLSQPVDLVTLTIANQGGLVGQFTKVEPYNGAFSWHPPEKIVGGQVISAEVVEAWIDVNKGKHQGD